MSEIASAFVSLLPSAKGFGSKMESQVGGEVSGAGKRLGSSFGKVFALGAGAIAAAGLGSFFKGAISDASDLSESASKVSVVFGDQAAAIMKASKTSATAMGLTKGAYLDAAGTLGNLLVSLDIAPKKSAAMSQQMVKLAGDLASFNNTSPEEALDALKSGLTGETEPLKRFGVNMNDATLKAQALKMGLIQNTKEALDPQTKALAAQALIMAQTGTAQGDFARTSGGLANQQRILAAQFGNVKATVGAALLPVVTKFVTFLNSAVLPAFGKIGPLASKVSGFFGKIGDAFGLLFAPGDALNGAHGFAEVLDNVFGNTGRLIAPLVQAGSVIQQVRSGISAFVFSLRTGFTGDTGIVGMFEQFGATVRSAVAQIMPALQTAGATFTTVVLPAVTSLVTYVTSALLPIFTRVAAIIGTQVIPIIASLATFFYGTLYPAVLQIAGVIAGNLKPVFDQLVATFQSRVLPAIQRLLAKFREWQPTIQQVVLVVVKIIGKVLEFAAAILGKVLPVAIRFAGFLIGTLVGAVIGAVNVLVKIVQGIIKVGQQFNEGAKQIDAFVRKGIAKVGEFLTFMGSLPGKIKAAFSGAATFLVSAGQDIIRGLINGIKNMAGAAISAAKNAVKGALDGAKSLLGIHSPSTKFAEVGKFSMLGLKKGIDDNAKSPLDAMNAALDKVRAGLSAQRDKIKGVVDQIASDMGSLADSVAGAFTGDLFGVSAITADLGDGASVVVRSVGQVFADALGDKRAEIKGLLSAFKKLKGWGIPGAFLGQLFASGNSALILEMAAGNRGDARQDARLFGQVTSLSNKLGGQVAQNQYGPELRKQTHRLDQIEAHLRRLPKNIGREINGAASAGHRARTA